MLLRDIVCRTQLWLVVSMVVKAQAGLARVAYRRTACGYGWTTTWSSASIDSDDHRIIASTCFVCCVRGACANSRVVGGRQPFGHKLGVRSTTSPTIAARPPTSPLAPHRASHVNAQHRDPVESINSHHSAHRPALLCAPGHPYARIPLTTLDAGRPHCARRGIPQLRAPARSRPCNPPRVAPRFLTACTIAPMPPPAPIAR